VIERAVARFSADPDVEAVVVGGSVAHGLAQDDSDVDFLLVVEDDALAARADRTFADAGLADYDGGYADVKLVSRAFLAEVAERGSEPARWEFADAFVAWSRVDGIEAALAAASAYPEDQRDAKVNDFTAHAVLGVWFLREAEKRGDRYLLVWGGSRTALWAGRAVLAHNRMLYPAHKWFLTALGRCPKQPDGFLEALDGLLADPGSERGAALVESVQGCVGVRPTIRESANAFLRRTEWNWRAGGGPFDDS